MGRKAGVTPEQTRAELLEAAARVFSTRGYDGATLDAIAADAGLSKGSIYGNYASKAELFAAVVREFGEREFRALAGWPEGPEAEVGVEEFVSRAGAAYARPRSDVAALVMEAVLAARRHPEIQSLISDWLLEGELVLRREIERAQLDGRMSSAVSPAEAARFLTLVGLGGRAAGVLDLPDVDEQRWGALVDTLIDALRLDPGVSG